MNFFAPRNHGADAEIPPHAPKRSASLWRKKPRGQRWSLSWPVTVRKSERSRSRAALRVRAWPDSSDTSCPEPMRSCRCDPFRASDVRVRSDDATGAGIQASTDMVGGFKRSLRWRFLAQPGLCWPAGSRVSRGTGNDRHHHRHDQRATPHHAARLSTPPCSTTRTPATTDRQEGTSQGLGPTTLLRTL